MSSIREQQHIDWIKSQAQALGFSFCGISKAGFLEEEADRLEQWLMQGEKTITIAKI